MASRRIAQISDLSFDDRNANRGTERGAAMIEHSLRTYGAGRSILLDKNGKIIAGNKTAENAMAAGIEQVEVVQSDGTKLFAVQRTDLDLDTDPRARELALIDNRTSEVGLDWDADIIAAFEQEGLDLSAMFTGEELDDLIGAAEDAGAVAAAPADFTSVDENLETAYCCPKCGYEWSGQPK
jgi:hypothetical protein